MGAWERGERRRENRWEEGEGEGEGEGGAVDKAAETEEKAEVEGEEEEGRGRAASRWRGDRASSALLLAELRPSGTRAEVKRRMNPQPESTQHENNPHPDNDGAPKTKTAGLNTNERLQLKGNNNRSPRG